MHGNRQAIRLQIAKDVLRCLDKKNPVIPSEPPGGSGKSTEQSSLGIDGNPLGRIYVIRNPVGRII